MADEPARIQDPPTTVFGRLRQVGPGLIIAASIVGSGELIATTKTGAQAGITLLWLIIIGCLIKVFVQVELGRYAISQGETTLVALDRVPGPRFRVGWLVWVWVIMTCSGIAQLGGIVGGVGQSLAITFPLTGDYADAIRVPAKSEIKNYADLEDDLAAGGEKFNKLSPSQQERAKRMQAAVGKQLDELGADRKADLLRKHRAGEPLGDPYTVDDRLWATIIAAFTSWLLFVGRYRVLQSVSLWLVGIFTIITVGNVIALQSDPRFALSASSFFSGLSFGLPEAAGIGTALATFGIIGVGASELVSYPYWCLEKGYAKFTGPQEDSETWLKRAKGWLTVMRWDAFLSMVLYTVATVMFFLMGAMVLFPEGRDPGGMRMVATLAESYVPVFGEAAKWLFLGGAIAVLYSTFVGALAANTRMYTDALGVFRFIKTDDDRVRLKWIKGFAIALPLTCAAIYWTPADPVMLVLISGALQAAMLPMLGGAALWFRYRRIDKRLHPRLAWDIFLWISSAGLLVAGLWGMYVAITKFAG